MIAPSTTHNKEGPSPRAPGDVHRCRQIEAVRGRVAQYRIEQQPAHRGNGYAAKTLEYRSSRDSGCGRFARPISHDNTLARVRGRDRDPASSAARQFESLVDTLFGCRFDEETKG